MLALENIRRLKNIFLVRERERDNLREKGQLLFVIGSNISLSDFAFVLWTLL